MKKVMQNMGKTGENMSKRQVKVDGFYTWHFISKS